MGKVKSYKDFLNEGIRDEMKPKSMNDIISSIDRNPKNIVNMFDSAGVDSDFLFSEILTSLPLEKVNEVFLDYISVNNNRLKNDDSFDNKGRNKEIYNHLKELVYLMKDNDDAWDDLTIQMYQELNDEQMKNVVQKLILKDE